MSAEGAAAHSVEVTEFVQAHLAESAELGEVRRVADDLLARLSAARRWR